MILICSRERSSQTDLDKKIIRLIQKAVKDWRLIVQATGGSLKQKKCYVSINSFESIRGKTVLKKLKNLLLKCQRSHNHTQPDGIAVPIPIIDPDTSKKTLSVLTNTTGKGKDQLAIVHKKYMALSDSLKCGRFLQLCDGFLSLSIQLKPQMEWGLLCMLANLDDVNNTIHAVYHASISHLCVSQKRIKEFWMLSEMCQGLGMFNLNIDSLGDKI